MSKRMSAGRVRHVYQFIETHRHEDPVRVMCEILKVAPSRYYEWLHDPLLNRAIEDARPLSLIRASFVASHDINRAPRVLLDMRKAGETRGNHRVKRLMRRNGLRALRGYRTR
jgi:putative transposase